MGTKSLHFVKEELSTSVVAIRNLLLIVIDGKTWWNNRMIAYAPGPRFQK